MSTETFTLFPPVGGSYDGPKRVLSEMIITVDFSSDSRPEDRTNPKFTAQVAYTEEAIRRLLKSDEYQQGKLKAALSRGTEGTDVEIGNPPSAAQIEESNARLRFGRIKPERGLVSLRTYGEMRDLIQPEFRMDPLQFCGAVIVVDTDVPDGFIRWFYGRV